MKKKIEILSISYISDSKDDDDSAQVIEELEKIDDDCDKHGIQFVKIDDKSASKEHGVKDVRRSKINLFIFDISIFSFSFQQLSSSRRRNQMSMKAI